MNGAEYFKALSHASRITAHGWRLDNTTSGALALRPEPDARQRYGLAESAAVYVNTVEEALAWLDGFAFLDLARKAKRRPGGAAPAGRGKAE